MAIKHATYGAAAAAAAVAAEASDTRPRVVVQPPAGIDRERYRRISRFIIKAALQIVWWDIVLNRPGLRMFRTPWLPRLRRLAHDYRLLAVEMGGVLIKFGQFLSTRVDILPAEITDELTKLQDQVPPDSTRAIVAQIEADLGRPLAEMFACFSDTAVGAASLAQAHQARLINGEAVVVKVLRPRIEQTVETDLQALALAVRLLKHYKRISSRVDLDWIQNEFVTVTRKELDFAVEGGNIERFALAFAGDRDICVPRVYWQYTAGHTLTMQDVSYIRVDDFAALESVGIDRGEVARKLFNNYMQQLFVVNLVHADPHAGNLFVRPLPYPGELGDDAGEGGFLPGDAVAYYPDRCFQIAFVDFGMMVSIPERLRLSLREYAIGLGTRDAQRIVKAYIDGGILAPGADVVRLHEMTEIMLTHFWGTFLGQIKGLNITEQNQLFLQQYVEFILNEAPLQLQADLLFAFRAMGILWGMLARLDPDFDSVAEVTAFAQRLVQDEQRTNGQPVLRNVVELGQPLLSLPRQLNNLLGQAQSGRLTLRTQLTDESQRSIVQLRRAVDRLSWVVAGVGLLLAGTVWRSREDRANGQRR